MEIMGLVIIVVLIAVGILLAILVFSKPIGKDVVYEQEGLLAANFLNTLVKSDASCRGRTVGELIQHCAKLDFGWQGAVSCDDGNNACDHALALIDKYAKEIFSGQNIKFFLSISGNDVLSSSFVFGERCKGEFESKSRPLVIVGASPVYLKLDICG